MTLKSAIQRSSLIINCIAVTGRPVLNGREVERSELLDLAEHLNKIDGWLERTARHSTDSVTAQAAVAARGEMK